MTRPTMPDEAQAILDEMSYSSRTFTEDEAIPWLETLAAMRVEESGRIVDPFTIDGGHQVKTTYRLVGEWQDKNAD